LNKKISLIKFPRLGFPSAQFLPAILPATFPLSFCHSEGASDRRIFSLLSWLPPTGEAPERSEGDEGHFIPTFPIGGKCQPPRRLTIEALPYFILVPLPPPFGGLLAARKGNWRLGHRARDLSLRALTYAHSKQHTMLF